MQLCFVNLEITGYLFATLYFICEKDQAIVVSKRISPVLATILEKVRKYFDCKCFAHFQSIPVVFGTFHASNGLIRSSR